VAVGVVFSLLGLPAGLAAAAAAPPAAGELKTGWHIVRPGDTLSGLANRYAGSLELWRRLHQLNPSIADPDRIEPGQRVEVILDGSAGSPAGQLRRLSHQVDEQPAPIPWQEAQRGDLLVERDAVRTAARSSAEIEFSDGARLTLTEDSLVFLHRAGGGALRAGAKKEVEVVQGQADFEAHGGAPPATPKPGATAASEVELIVGAAHATSALDDKGLARTRARRADGGAAKVMMYGGHGEVAAGGAKVALPGGMGTSVEASGPPSPPEKLLPAPRLTEPELGAKRACATPRFAWTAVDGAASYTFELCRDPGCAELVARKTDLRSAEWKAEPLPAGEVYWRVTARSASGLDGYPSPASGIAILAARADLAPPAGELQVAGPSVRVGERLFVGAATQVGIAVADPAVRWQPAIDGRAGAPPPATWSAGDHSIAAAAVDACGSPVVGAPIPFTVDTAPPEIRLQVAARKVFEERGLLASDDEDARRRTSRRAEEGRPARGYWPAISGVWQVPLPWVRERRRQSEPVLPIEPLTLASDHPQAFLRLRDTRLTVDGKDQGKPDGSVLWIAAEDAGAGVERLTIQERVERDRVVLTVEALDAVGNKSQKELVLRAEGTPGAR
jgi:hypothetical protein